MAQRTYDPRTDDPRFDHRPTLLIWAIATAVCVLVLAVAVFVSVQPAAPPSTSNGNPAIHARSADGEPLTGTEEEFARAQFDNPTQIDNKYYPLEPGTQWVYKGSSIVEDGSREEHRIVYTVTDLTKVVDGVRTLVVYDEDWHAGVLLEPEVRFHAQANDGTVWYFGEYREENNADGKLVEPRAWIPDQKGAREGISMPAEPRLGTPSYAQGYAPPLVNWIDRGRVYKLGQKTCVPVDCYENVVVIEEFERNKPGAFQTKYYAPGVGEVRTGWRGEKEEERETVKLVDYQHLSPEAMAKIREKAIELDRRGYDPPKVGPYWQYTKEVYRHTQPVEHTLQVE
jgi:hypothetical protein